MFFFCWLCKKSSGEVIEQWDNFFASWWCFCFVHLDECFQKCSWGIRRPIRKKPLSFVSKSLASSRLLMPSYARPLFVWGFKTPLLSSVANNGTGPKNWTCKSPKEMCSKYVIRRFGSGANKQNNLEVWSVATKRLTGVIYGSLKLFFLGGECNEGILDNCLTWQRMGKHWTIINWVLALCGWSLTNVALNHHRHVV